MLAILNPAGGVSFKHRRVTVAWNTFKFDGQTDPAFRDRVEPQALADGTSFKEAGPEAGQFL